MAGGIRVHLRFVGLDKAEQILIKDREPEVKRVVQYHGAKLQQRMKKNAKFDKGYSLGYTQLSIKLEPRDGGLAAAVGPTTEYAPYLECGTRLMEAQPFAKKSLEQQSQPFRNDLLKVLRLK